MAEQTDKMHQNNNQNKSPDGNKLKSKLMLAGKFLLKYKILIIIVAMLISFLPKIYDIENEVGMRAIITSLGIDRIEEGYEVTAQVFIPNMENTKSQKKEITSVKVTSIAEITDKITLKIGRVVSLYHCGLILLGRSLLEEGCLPALDFLVRHGQISWGAMVQATDNTAKDTLTGINSLEETGAFSWQRFLNSKKKHTQSTSIDLKSFLNDNYDMTKSSYISVINMVDAEESKGEEGGGGEGASAIYTAGGEEGGGKEGGGKESPKQIDEKVKIFLVKEGKLTGELIENESNGINWLDKEAINNILQVEGINNEMYGNGIVSVDMKDKRVRKKFFFKDGMPHLKLTLDVVIEEVEIMAESNLTFFTEKQREEYRKPLYEKLKDTIKGEFQSTINKCIDAETDALRMNIYFFRYAYKDYNKYIENRSYTDLLKDLQIDYNIEIKMLGN